jgi:hypothetical protein
MVNVKVKRCIENECEKQATYDKRGMSSGIYCNDHKLPGMVNMNGRRCVYCNKVAYFNVGIATWGLCCDDHKFSGMVNVVKTICKAESCNTQISNKYRGFCQRCFRKEFPDELITHNYKTKEFAVGDFLESKFPNTKWISDKQIRGGESGHRPDLLLDIGHQVIIIEVDEHQHKGYKSNADNTRILELSDDVDNRPIVLIRFNPDAYNKGGTRIASCWGLNDDRICVV